ncbi:MFS transporter [Citromicrobium bathyomarinum]
MGEPAAARDSMRLPPPLLAFFISALAGTIGHAMFVYGIVVILTDAGDGALQASIVFAVAFLVMGLMTPVRGFLGDVVPIARLIRNCGFGMALAALAFALAVPLSPAPSVLFVAALLSGALYGYAAGGVAGNRIAMVALVTSRTATPTIILSMMTVFGFTFGPLLYAVGRVQFGDFAAMMIVAAILLLSALSLPQPDGQHEASGGDRSGAMRGILDGVAHIFSNRSLWQALLLGIVPTLFVLGPVQSVMPQMLASAFPGKEIFRGLVFVALGLGTLVGGIVSTRFAQSPSRQSLVIYASLLACAAIVAATSFLSQVSVLVLIFICGIGLGVPHAIVPVILQDRVDNSMRARTMAALTLKLTGVPAIGAALCGILASASDARFALLVLGCCGLATGLLLARFDRPSQSASAID